MNKQLKNKMVYEWLHNGEVFYVGIGGKRRPYSESSRNPYCTRKRAKAEKEGTFEIRIKYYNLTWEEACEIEIQLIEQYGRLDLGTGCLTNMTSGGELNDHWTGKTHKKETKEKIRKTLIEMTKDKEWKSLQSKRVKEEWQKGTYDNVIGRKHTPEVIELMREQKKRGKHPRAKPVQTPLGRFECQQDAADAHGISKMKISRRIRDFKYPEYFKIED